jgi:endoglucanase
MDRCVRRRHGLTPAQANQGRYDQLNHAVDALGAHRNVSVYLDGTHSAWLGVGDIADRLVKGGVQRAQGFFLNVSNYRYAPNSAQYGTWISDCIAYAAAVHTGDFASCPNRYWNGGPDGTAIAALLGAWNGVALTTYGVWTDSAGAADLNTSGINARFASMLGNTVPITRFVVDTSLVSDTLTHPSTVDRRVGAAASPPTPRVDLFASC